MQDSERRGMAVFTGIIKLLAGVTPEKKILNGDLSKP